MAYMDREHKAKVDMFNTVWDSLNGLERLAKSYDINDITQDNNLKLLQTFILFDFEKVEGREGADARDRYGNLWELKTVNAALVSGVSTNHHCNLKHISDFRQERWLFSIYKGIHLEEVYAMSPGMLEHFFSKWEADLLAQVAAKEAQTGEPLPEEELLKIHKNNPKISIKYIRDNGIKVYPVPDPPIDPAEALK